jgi:hypothetical protein
MNTESIYGRINESTLTDGSKVYDIDLLNEAQEVVTRIPCIDKGRAWTMLAAIANCSNVAIL